VQNATNSSVENEMETGQQPSSDEDDEDWENVSLDLIRWNILLKQIEDLSFLSTILAQRPKIPNPKLPLLPHQQEELSVVSLMEKGKGNPLFNCVLIFKRIKASR